MSGGSLLAGGIIKIISFHTDPFPTLNKVDILVTASVLKLCQKQFDWYWIIVSKILIILRYPRN